MREHRTKASAPKLKHMSASVPATHAARNVSSAALPPPARCTSHRDKGMPVGADAKAAASGHARSTAGGKEAMHAVFREEISRALRTETRKWSRRRRKLSDWHVFRAKSWWEQANVAGHERRY